jgi:multimeric flavodoxin WrbA
MSKNIVLLSGSPRKGGNTDKLAGAFVKGAESVGKSVVVFRVADMDIHGCMGCGHCMNEGNDCVQKDDMAQILGAIMKADALVFATPVYFFSATGQMKLAIDRIYALLRKKMPVKRAALLMTCGAKLGDAGEGIVSMYNRILQFNGWDNAGVIMAPNLHGINDIDGRNELVTAGKLGREI